VPDARVPNRAGNGCFRPETFQPLTNKVAGRSAPAAAARAGVFDVRRALLPGPKSGDLGPSND